VRCVTRSCMPATNLFLLFTRRLHELGVPYVVGGGLRDIRSILDTSPDLVRFDELEGLIRARGLREAWKRTQAPRA
jgi:hypothetical protein